MMWEWISQSTTETRKFGEWIGGLVSAGTVLCLTGDLGAGKTSLIQGIARGLGIEEPVTSPTFTLVNVYDVGRLPLYHIDLYRINSPEESYTIGLEEYLYGDGLCAIEWAERVSSLWPPEYLHITLAYLSPTQRLLRFEPHGLAYRELLDRLRELVEQEELCR